MISRNTIVQHFMEFISIISSRLFLKSHIYLNHYPIWVTCLWSICFISIQKFNANKFTSTNQSFKAILIPYISLRVRASYNRYSQCIYYTSHIFNTTHLRKVIKILLMNEFLVKILRDNDYRTRGNKMGWKKVTK